ncbi:MAG: restriction endonuclease, partial [Bacteroidota bacterium]
MSIARHHNDWLSLVPNSGPFLSLPVLVKAFPQGLEAHDVEHARRLRLAFNEWDEDQSSPQPTLGIHREWIRFVLRETLDFEGTIAEGQAIPQTLKSDIAEQGEELRPDLVINDPATNKARVLVQLYPRSQSLTRPLHSARWKASPDTRMMQLLHDTGIRLGIVTNGDHWMLVNAAKSEATGYISWYANIWLEEQGTLRAFRTLLGSHRLFGVPDDETLEALLDKSAADQQEVTDQLGYQVRKAVEVLIQALDSADQHRDHELLADVPEKLLYESALTVMMRLVFLFCAEERELLLLGDELYDRNYAVSTLREQLRTAADQHGEEILARRYDAWARLLTTFRAIYGGINHDRLKLPPYGGSLFNPDRFPFLEGRKSGTHWKSATANPMRVSNRTVLHLLEALQMLQVKLPGGGPSEARKISFRELNIEQIGHVYEGLLDHTAVRATEPVLGLKGTRDKEPEILLSELERIAAKGEAELLKFLKEETGRSESALKKGLMEKLDGQLAGRFRTASQDEDVWNRVMPFAGLVRLDTNDYPIVITAGSVFVTAGTDRRSSGTHYTPRSLTEPIVQYTLEPLVYIGPAEGLPKEEWKLRTAGELLDLKICDMACGSGAFLVQACRYMGERLLEAWDEVQRANPDAIYITPKGKLSNGSPSEILIPSDPDERQAFALRIVAQQCLYGVDKNPLAVEMAKLSLWLLTLAKDKPFEFLDHAIRCGDSLVGIHNLDQLRTFTLDNTGETSQLFANFLNDNINDIIARRRRIATMQANTVEDVEVQEQLLREVNKQVDRLRYSADMLIGAEFVSGSASAKRDARVQASIEVRNHFNDNDLEIFQRKAKKALDGQVPFHWALEFPEVMVEREGFDAFVGNPPFMGGQKITNAISKIY